MSQKNGRKLLLKMTDVDTHYGVIQVLRKVNVEIYEGEMVCLLGGNASGKSTTLKTILGYVSPSAGSLKFLGEEIGGLATTEIVSRGISLVPENRRIFGRMTVLENLEMGAYMRNDKQGIQQDMERIFELFPRLKERTTQYGGDPVWW